ncbi:trans-resveratrol di-O-methyltransferase-like isoform X2 [Andrographis paniculata]|nr:trans-resveratrol di-O-methyltransferase-like isoform X2 [Andrographis paniculata]
MKLSELTNALSLGQDKSPFLDRLMRIMIHSKFFIKAKIFDDSDQSGYWITPSSLLLLKNEASSVAPFALAMLDPVLTDPWHQLSKWLGTSHATPFITTHGRDFWEEAGGNATMNTFFNEGMASDARLMLSIMTKDCRHVFQGLESIVDVGGGTGIAAKAIVDAFPGLKCAVLDLPHVVAGLESTKDLNYVDGDMFESIPCADAVFMKWILHDWPDKECVKILENCREAIMASKEKGGKVIIVDIVIDEDEGRVGHELRETQLCFDMMMMVLVSGKERTEKEWANLFDAAGFKSYKVTRILGVRSLIEVFP